MSRRPRWASGITLLEMLTAALLGVVVVLAMGQVDVTRIYLSDQVRRASSAYTEAASAMSQMVRLVQRADRVVVDSGNESLQIRIPTDKGGLDFDQAASYDWLQFRRDASTGQLVQYNPAGCTIAARYGHCSGTGDDDACFTQFSLRYRDEAPAPPGGDPNPEDNNSLELELFWTDPKTGRTQRYQGQAILRAGAYSDVNAQSSGGVMDSGTGLSPVGLAAPPPVC